MYFSPLAKSSNNLLGLIIKGCLILSRKDGIYRVSQRKHPLSLYDFSTRFFTNKILQKIRRNPSEIFSRNRNREWIQRKQNPRQRTKTRQSRRRYYQAPRTIRIKRNVARSHIVPPASANFNVHVSYQRDTCGTPTEKKSPSALARPIRLKIVNSMRTRIERGAPSPLARARREEKRAGQSACTERASLRSRGGGEEERRLLLWTELSRAMCQDPCLRGGLSHKAPSNVSLLSFLLRAEQPGRARYSVSSVTRITCCAPRRGSQVFFFSFLFAPDSHDFEHLGDFFQRRCNLSFVNFSDDQ